MFTQKPCLPVCEPRKRKRHAQSSPYVQEETAADGSSGTTWDDIDSPPAVNHQHNDDDYEEDDDNDCDGESDPEMNAAAYLYRVREEARQLPDIWTAGSTLNINGHEQRATVVNSYTELTETNTSASTNHRQSKRTATNLAIGSIASLNYLTSQSTKIYPPPTLSHIPMAGKKWVDQILAEFSHLRISLEHCKNGSKDLLSERKPVPPMKDFMAWYTFCIGRHHVYPRGGIVITSTTITPPNQDTLPTPAWEINLPSNGDGYTPSVSLLLQMDQVMVRRVLSHLTTYLDHVSIDDQPSSCFVWIYALLARLERPLHRDDAVTLFKVLKRLTLLRYHIPEVALSTDSLETTPCNTIDHSTTSTIPPKDGNIKVDDAIDLSNPRQFLATLNTLIAIVGVYFEQGGNYSKIMDVPYPV